MTTTTTKTPPVTRRREGGTMDHHPANTAERIAAFRQIVDEKSMAKIDGHAVDLFSASLVVRTYDALNEKNRERFMNRDAHGVCVMAYAVNAQAKVIA